MEAQDSLVRVSPKSVLKDTARPASRRPLKARSVLHVSKAALFRFNASDFSGFEFKVRRGFVALKNCIRLKFILP